MRNDNRASIRKVIAFIVYIICIVFIITFAASRLKYVSATSDERKSVGISVAGYYPIIVVTGSMEPAIKVNSLSICKTVDIDDVEVGDIVAFEYAGELITHRVIEKTTNSAGNTILHTKGDANLLADRLDITEDMLRGQVIYTNNKAADVISRYLISPGEFDSLAIAQTTIWLFVTIGIFAAAIHWIWGFLGVLLRVHMSDDAYATQIDMYIDDINELLKYRDLLLELKLKGTEGKHEKHWNKLAHARAMREIKANHESVKDFNKAMKQVIRFNKVGVYLDKSDKEEEKKNHRKLFEALQHARDSREKTIKEHEDRNLKKN